MQIARIALGTVISATSGTDPSAKLFADLSADLPLLDPLKTFTPWIFGTARITSTPQSMAIISPTQLSTTISTVTSTAAQPQQIVQAVDIGGGIGLQFWSSHSTTDLSIPNWFTFSLVAGGGAITPLSADQATQAISVYNATSPVQDFYSGGATHLGQYAANADAFKTACFTTATPAAPQSCYVAFVPEDRSRFYRNYMGGFRLKYYYRDVPSANKQNYYPATFDATFGQNEFVTGGRLGGVVFHGSGFFRVPGYPVYLFGSMDLGLKGRGDTPGPPLQLAPSSVTYSATSANIVTVVVPPPNRDRYSLGIAVDLATIFHK